ncbi:MAG: ParA family protein [Dissulfurispiraceae bacterium]
MHIISVANHKGGVGKTTSAVNIAACWAETGEKVLLIDLDPQGSASMSYGVKNSGDDLLNALQKTMALPIVRTLVKGVDVVPSGPKLAAARQRFTGALGKELLFRCLKETKGDWEKVIIDCPPSLGILTMTALWASRHVVIPVEANYLALSGLNQMMDALALFGNDHLNLDVEAIIPCRAHPRRRIHQKITDELEKLFPGKVSPFVRENVAIAEAPGLGQPIFLYAPKSKGATDYRQVAVWLSDHIGRKKK